MNLKNQFIRNFSLMILLCVSSSMTFAKTQVTKLVCEYHVNPIGIDVQKPRFSWKITSDQENEKQTAYEIRVADSPANLNKVKSLIWTSGKVGSDQSVNVEYAGLELKSMQRAYWQVRIWDKDQKVTPWSEPAFWEMGILESTSWKASWITMKDEQKSATSLPAQYYRSEFSTSKKISSARVYVTSLGLYQLFLNGKKVGDQLFTPGFTSYKKRIQYQTYDVSAMLQPRNTIGAMVGDGWYRGYLGWDGLRSYYGDQLALFVQLQVNYTDGTSETITTDENWKSAYGAILESDIYNGEKYDARLEPKGWNSNGFDDSKWANVAILDHPKEILVASNGLPVKAIEEITPVKIITTPKGELVFDLGQNIVGWARMKVNGKKGDQVTLQFAEVLDKEGNFFMKNLRSAKATDVYTLKGDGEEVFEPHFTFHGFRFIKIEGYPGTLTADKITGIVIHSDMKPTGTFTCSDSLINQLQSNIQWGQRDNFLDIPTDCPQRDERVGWTGDAQVFSMTAAFNFNTASFFTKWLKDLALDQQPNGEVPNIIPDMWNNNKGGATGWGDAAVIVPWTLYQVYGDKRILEEQYPSMKAWVEYMINASGADNLWNDMDHWHWGDWLAYHSDSPDYAGAFTEKDLIATAYFKHSTELLSKMAKILGKTADAEKYGNLIGKIKKAFVDEYLSKNGRLVSHTQTAYALALSFDLIPENLRQKSADYFADDVKKFGHLTTGFLCTPLLCSTLSSIGRDDLAFMLLNRKDYPGWLYPVTQGATTIWERWDTQKPDGSIIDGMNSFNHYAYGAIGEWLYNHVAGLSLDPENPGYKHIIFSPHPGGGLTNASAEFESMYGLVKSAWKIVGKEFVYDVEIPANTTATVILPHSKEVKRLGSGKYRLSETIPGKNQSNLIFLNEERLEKVKVLIEKKDTFFTEAYNRLILDADKELSKIVNPVTNKTQIPPSGDKHDYMSMAPYWWPNPETADGFPWILKDGETNPMTRGDHTDKVRLSEMFEALNKLSMAYYFSDDLKYAEKAKSVLKIWFINDSTKVNPNVNFGQGVPRQIEGRRAGIIEWRSISTVITTIQLLSSNGLLPDVEMKGLNTWIAEYYNWLKTSPMGVENDNGLQNHSTCYDYQMVGLARYLGLNAEAKSRLEAAKLKRIASQIEPDGSQPRELGRTKSIHYCSMNLKIMTFVAEMGMPLGVDLWNYSSDDGRSMRKAFNFLKPFAEGKETWTHKQITEGGIEKAIEDEMYPLFSIASTIYGEELIDKSVQAHQSLTYMEKLQYPPLLK